MYNIII